MLKISESQYTSKILLHFLLPKIDKLIKNFDFFKNYNKLKLAIVSLIYI